jgi:cell division ATPase FtsA
MHFKLKIQTYIPCNSIHTTEVISSVYEIGIPEAKYLSRSVNNDFVPEYAMPEDKNVLNLPESMYLYNRNVLFPELQIVAL